MCELATTGIAEVQKEVNRMNDLISRQALCEYALNQKDKSVTPNDIMRFPSAQPEIIRCKDCKHWVKTEGDERWSLGDCGAWERHFVMCNGYCAWAERREDE